MQVIRWTGLVAGLVVVAIAVAFLLDMRRAYERVRDRGTVISTAFGILEYTQGGSGTPVLVVHGSGGGWDQAELIAESALGNTFHWIAPSRFGYLRSTFHEGGTWDDQAHAYAALLDHLGLERVAVVAMSQGGPSALLFAVLHPERVQSLTLLSCGVATATNDGQAKANEKGDTLTSIFRHDIFYWTIARFWKPQLMALIGIGPEVNAELTDEQRALAERFINEMNPASLRFRGVLFDNTATMPGARIASITAPTLIVHATDDSLQLFHNAEFAAATIPGAKLIRYDRGGHFLLGVEQAAIREAVASHILGDAGELAEPTAR